jgi:hypothetical protein
MREFMADMMFVKARSISNWRHKVLLDNEIHERNVASNQAVLKLLPLG